MINNNITKTERYISASSYLFWFVYEFLSLFRTKSEFIEFHSAQARRLTWIEFPAVIIIILGLIGNFSFSLYLIGIGIIILIIGLILSIICAIYALKGVKKKII
jgi:uncharacterized membrane protein